MKRTQSKIVQNNQEINPQSQTLQYLGYGNTSIPQNQIQVNDVIVIDQPEERHEIQIHTATLNHKTSNKEEKASETWTQLQGREKLPASLKLSLRKRAQQSGHFKEKRDENTKKSRFGQVMSSAFKKEEISCGICLGVVSQRDIVSLCKCNHMYCKNCVRDYATYKIKMFEEVACPNQACDIVMNKQTEFYNNLADELKKQYEKIHRFYMTANDSSLKLCPKEDCEGIIKIVQSQPRICDKCKRQFCAKCYFQKHQGNCDQKQIDFLQNDLHYRQCSNCKIIVQRIQGCNHMTCRCKYQFCYLCGNKWQGQNHACNQIQQPIGFFDEGSCCDCFGCCQNAFGNTCASIIKLPLRLLLSLLLLIYVACISANTLFVLLIYFLLSIIAGIFGYSTDYLCGLCDDGDQCMALILVMFFPIPMCVGLYRAFTEMFIQVAQEQCSQLGDVLTSGCEAIWS